MKGHRVPAGGADISSCEGLANTRLKLCIEEKTRSYSEIVLNTSHPCEHKKFFGYKDEGVNPIIYPPKGSIQFVVYDAFQIHFNENFTYFFFFADRRFMMNTLNPSIIPQFYIKVPKQAGNGYMVLEVINCPPYLDKFYYNSIYSEGSEAQEAEQKS